MTDLMFPRNEYPTTEEFNDSAVTIVETHRGRDLFPALEWLQANGPLPIALLGWRAAVETVTGRAVVRATIVERQRDKKEAEEE